MTSRALLLYAVACIVLGLYCLELNRQLYQHQCPFYDSLSYYEQLFRIMTVSREEGICAGLNEACFTSTTVCLPFTIAAAIGPLVKPNRCVGIWIQTGFLFLFLTSLHHYLKAIRGLKTSTATLAGLAFLGSACLFYDNGGLSDFRMDLGLFLTFGATVCWFLSAIEKPAWWRFAVLGLAAGACCLARATAPVYLIVAFLPVVTFEVFIHSQPKQKILGLLFSVTLAAVVSGWFFVANYEYLHFYYAVWNTDANAKIPWLDAFGHPKMVFRCIGEPLSAMLVAWATGIVVVGKKSTATESQSSEKPATMGWDLRILWIGIAPLAIMMGRRAGLNPFVCMPALIGIVLFVMLPLLHRLESIRSKSLFRFCWICLLICLLIAAGRGWRRHQIRSAFDSMTAQHQVMDFIIDDSQQFNKTEFRFGALQMTELNTHSLYSTLLFDRRDVTRNLNEVRIGTRNYLRVPVFSLPAAADWDLLPGKTDTEKIDGLMNEANEQIDYLVVPDPTTTEHLQKSYGHNYVNRYQELLRVRVIDGDWQKVGSPIQVQKNEVVEIYRNLLR